MIVAVATVATQVMGTDGLVADEAGRPIRLVTAPTISPGGLRIAFSWIGEIWTAKLDGSDLTRLTHHPDVDSDPLFSPDGSRIAFVSTRTGSPQIHIMGLDGTGVRQITHHSGGYAIADWFPDGRSILAVGSRDHHWRGSSRLIRVHTDDRRAEEILVDATAADPQLSPDGTRVLFVREGERWWRKGYTGERAAQIWEYDLDSGEFTEHLHEGVDCRWPLWRADGKGFYFTKGDVHGFDLYEYRFGKGGKAGTQKPVVGFEEDSIVFPSISDDGRTILFRHLFDLYHYDVKRGGRPKPITLTTTADTELPDDVMRRELTSTGDVAFTADGLEIAFIAGGDVWVIDTTLREPVQVTATPGYESEVIFGPDGESLYYVGITDGIPDIIKATRKDEDAFWWQNDEFITENVTEDTAAESNLRFTPDGKTLLYQRGRGNLVAMEIESGERFTITDGFGGVRYDVSPDSRWIAYSLDDDDFNSEVWLARLKDGATPINVSRHPDNDSGPVFSPDGKILAFTGRRVDQEIDIYYVYLNAEADEETSRQRKLDEALATMRKKRGDPKKNDDDDDKNEKKSDEDQDENKSDADDAIVVDTDDIHERLRRISIPNSSESGLIFAPEGNKLAFTATVGGKRGIYTVEFPDKLTPKLLSSSTGSVLEWSKEAGGIFMIGDGKPAKLSSGGSLTTYSFTARQQTSRSEYLAAMFDAAWLTMREVWYDDAFAGRNWAAIRRKYHDVAGQIVEPAGLAQVVELMLGELNGSHLGFYASGRRSGGEREGWTDQTAHLGVRFDPDHNGPGLRVRDVLPDGPADRRESRLYPGDIITAIDGTAVDPDYDLTLVLNGRLDRDVTLTVERADRDEEPADEPADDENVDGENKDDENKDDQADSDDEKKTDDEKAKDDKSADEPAESDDKDTKDDDQTGDDKNRRGWQEEGRQGRRAGRPGRPARRRWRDDDHRPADLLHRRPEPALPPLGEDQPRPRRPPLRRAAGLSAHPLDEHVELL